MIELSILEHLKSALSVPVYMEHPEFAPDRFVLIEKTGSGRNNQLPTSTFAFQSYAESVYQAAALNGLVKLAVDNLITLEEIAAVKLNSDYNFTDSSTKRYRYQAIYDINHY